MEGLGRVAREEPDAAELVRLRVFAGLSVEQAAEMLGVSRATGYRQGTYARTWLRAENQRFRGGTPCDRFHFRELRTPLDASDTSRRPLRGAA